jgi:hypothetical protein
MSPPCWRRSEEALVEGVVRGSGSAERGQAPRRRTPRPEAPPRSHHLAAGRSWCRKLPSTERNRAASDPPCRTSTVRSELVGQASRAPRPGDPADVHAGISRMRRPSPVDEECSQQRRPNASSRRSCMSAPQPSAPHRPEPNEPTVPQPARSAPTVPAPRIAGDPGRGGSALSPCYSDAPSVRSQGQKSPSGSRS